jgi:hypothetical protein
MFIRTLSTRNAFDILAEHRSKVDALAAMRRTWAERLARGPSPPGAPSPPVDPKASLGAAVDDLRTFLARLAGGAYLSVGGAPFLTPGSVASVGGALPVVTGTPSRLEATRQVNEQTSTVRASSAALALDTTTPERSSTLTSTAEINTAATSYGDVELTFGGSVSKATLSGVYTGTGSALLASSLEVKIVSNATLSTTTASALHFKVFDQNGVQLLNFSGNVKAGDQISLGPDIGLSISFSAGGLTKNTSDTTTVSRTTPTDVNPNATFDNADVNLRPRFENGAQVVAGSFTVNGTQINVYANDTINTVLARISSSAAGVTASFAGDRITLTSTNASETDIVLANDTSGFLAATKLAGATTSRGVVRDDLQAMADVAAFSGVQAGSFRVNGVTIAVNPATDSLASVLARVTSSGAGVTATFDTSTRKVTFTPNTPGATLILDGDTSGFLAAANVFQGARGTAANPAGTFDGAGASDPLLDPGVTVGPGSFQVNGVSIQVLASDSIQSVLDRITSSAAGVTAWFDTASETVRLQAKTVGATPITVGNDSSGFLAAVKLDTAHSTPGTGLDQTDLDAPIANVPALSGVRAGAVTVNGESISVNPQVHSLRSVVSAIDALPGVSATITEAGQVNISGEAVGGKLELSDTTGLLGLLGISVGTATGRPDVIEAGGASALDAGRAIEDLAGAVGRLNQAVASLFGGRHLSSVAKTKIAELFADAREALGEQSGYALGVAGARPPEIALDREGLHAFLARDPDDRAEALETLGSLASGLPALVQGDDDARAAEARAAEIETGTPVAGERAQMSPESRVRLERRLDRNLNDVLESALLEIKVEPTEKKKADEAEGVKENGGDAKRALAARQADRAYRKASEAPGFSFAAPRPTTAGGLGPEEA